MIVLRRACRPEMNYGDFLDDIGLGPLPEGVYARIFRRADRGRLAVTLLDRRKENRTPFTLSVDLAAVGVGGPKQVRLVTMDGEQALPALRQAQGGPEHGRGAAAPAKDSRLEISVPVFPERAAALLIEVEKRNTP
jgi:hypothetical protein